MIIIEDGKIIAFGQNLSVDESNYRIINGEGMHLTPGIVDEHSHIALTGVNEGSQSVTSEVRMKDVVNSEDVNIYRQLAGGVTTAQLLHGSANPIGGQSAIIKLIHQPEEMLVEGADEYIKFALGENVKRSRAPSSLDFQILEWELSKYLLMLSTELRFIQIIGLIIIVCQKKKN